MKINNLPKVFVILFFFVFLGVFAFFMYQQFFLQESNEVLTGEENFKAKSIQDLKSSEEATELLIFESINKQNREIYIDDPNNLEGIPDMYVIDRGTVLVCLESRENLENTHDFSNFNLWESDSFKQVLTYNDEFLRSLEGKFIKLIFENNTNNVVAVVVGGCQ